MLSSGRFCRGRARVIIECPSCNSKYNYDEERFERRPSKKIKCARCQTIFDIHNPAFAPVEAAVDVGDSTYTSRQEDPRNSAPAPEANEPEVQPQTGKNEVAPQLPQGKRLSLAILDGP